MSGIRPVSLFNLYRAVPNRWQSLVAVVACVMFCSSSAIAWSADEPAAADSSGEHAHHDEDHHHGDEGHHHGDGDHEHGDHAGADHGDEDHAEDHGEGHHAPPLLSLDPGAAIWNLVIFLAVLAVLSKFVWPNILGGLQAREDKIRADLEGAEKANIQAKAMLSEYQQKLDDAATQVQTMLAEARKDAETNGQKIIEDAKAEAARQQERAMADIETAKKVALSELAGQTSDMAIAVAGQVVGRELKADDHADLIRQSLDRLPSNN